MMDNPAPEGLKLSTQKDQYSIVPGGKLEIPVTLVNPGNVADQVRISVEGIPLVWVSTEQLITLLQPGEERQVILTIQPPPTPNAPIGRYNLGLRAESVIVSGRSAQIQVKLTVAGFEVKGRLGVLLESLQYAVHPGEQVEIPLVFINQGLAADTFRLSVKELPTDWTVISTSVLGLEPGESQQVIITIKPPRLPSARASRYSFQVLASSQAAPDQGASIDCTLTVAAFIEFAGALEAPQPDQNLPARVSIQNQSNIPVTFQVNWSSPEDTLIFEPAEPARVNLPLGETAVMDYSAQPKRRPLFGGEKSFPYTVTVQASDQQAQNLEGAWPVKALLPIWVLIAGLVVLVILCVILFSTLFSARC